MKFNLLPVSGKQRWRNNKPFIWFLLCLLLIHSVLKIIFYQYNHALIFSGAASDSKNTAGLQLIKWSLANDLLTLLAINIFLLFAITLGQLVSKKISYWLILPLFVLINSFAVMLNLIDIFYFRFHFQRANADLLYVIDHPFNRLMQQNFFIIFTSGICIASIIWLIWVLHKKLYNSFSTGNNCRFITAILFVFAFFIFLFKNTFSKFLVPTYPLVTVKSNQLPMVQNSFQTFVYSVFRNGAGNHLSNYMTNVACDSIFPIRKKLKIDSTTPAKPNIVLFIMESIPFDFFDSSSVFKVSMPFFDSLLQKSIFFNNAFCYAHESNKGITAILAGIPTLADIPVYHSSQINMPVTPIGSALKKLNYQSLFCIGDEYDNFGFAKCANWMGMDKYYSQEDIPDYKNLPAHSMGLQDENVLRFFLQKINDGQKPFFAVHYNISTHFPYDIPEKFAKQSPAAYSDAMKAMQYYDYSLQKFFNAAKNEAWFANTKFIFCSDHWLFPQGKPGPYTAVSAYHIPIIIYNPLVSKKQTVTTLASQFDVASTILATAGYSDSTISYGNNLLDSSTTNNSYAFARPGNTIYQVMDSSYILGFNIITNKPEFLYNYKIDIRLTKNLLDDKNVSLILNNLLVKIKAFLQKANTQYNGNAFK
jgi:phosphoglycerol transferase MdoB-like AlkP superfamily enzyme